MPSITKDTLVGSLPVLRELDNSLLIQLSSNSRLVHLSPNQSLFREGDICNHYLLVIEGRLRIQKVTASGHELVLYHIQKGQECNLTNTCLLGGQHYPAEAIAEDDTDVLLISRKQFYTALEKVPHFRDVVFSNIENGMSKLVNLIQDIAFGHMDQRLAAVLLEQSDERSKLKTTHQTLASELGTAREVVSRLLKEFERHGWVKLSRGIIKINNHHALMRLCNTSNVT